MDIIFATGNKHKVKEVSEIIDLPQFNVLSLSDIGYYDDIPETASTLKGNALIKARTIHEKFGKNVFSEDTGLEVQALNMEPGVFSARYAGAQKSSEDNMDLLLKNLNGVSNRKARFRTVVALIFNDEEFLFEGEVWGKIGIEKSGNEGFGYDPIFIPDGYLKPFAELPSTIKSIISHRYNAISKLSLHLNQRL